MEGWRDLNHSYSLVNQWQLLELLRRPLQLRHRDMAPFNPAWNPRSYGSGLPAELLDRIRQIPAPQAGEHFSAIYRISFPLNLLPGPADQVFVLGTPGSPVVMPACLLAARPLKPADATTSRS